MKPLSPFPRQNSGYVLIEAMVAMVVVAVGLLGIGKLNALLLQGSGGTKTRAEALQLAQGLVEQLRNYRLDTGCAGVTTTGLPTSYTGVNAAYTISTTLSDISGGTPATVMAKAVQVCVTWDGGSCSSAGNRIVLNSALACTGLGTSARIGGDNVVGGSSRSGFIKSPTGRGTVGGQTYSSIPNGASSNTMPGTNNAADGTYSYVTGQGNRELIGTDGKVLLTVQKLACETTAPDFSTVSGKVFVQAKNGAPIAASSDLFILSSDASYCTKLPYNNNWVLPAGATGNSIQYFYTYYKCYIGAEWWGNISPVRTDNPNANNRVCVGNPNMSNIGTLFSKHPQLSSVRGYRGYREKTSGSGIYESVGIGEQSTDSSTCVGRKQYIAQNYQNHHFIHTVLTGSADDSACGTELTTLNSSYSSQAVGSTTNSNPAVTDTTSNGTVVAQTSVANNNPGKFYCMSSADGVSCPTLTGSTSTPSTYLHGTITRTNGATVTGINASELGSTCSNLSFSTDANNNYSYSCQIKWTGFIGNSWQGVISFDLTSGHSLCATGSSVTVAPSTSSVSYTIHDKNASPDPNAIKFTDIPTTVTDIALNFTANNTSCGLGQVSLQWTGSSDPKSLTWSAISGATGYQIEKCTSTNNNSLTPCTSWAVVNSNTTATTYAQGAPGTKDTICVRVQAKDSSSTGAYSPTKCVYRNASGNTYTYQ